MKDWPILTTLLLLPVVGALFLAILRGSDEAAKQNARWIALWTSLVTFALSLVLLVNYDPSNSGFQFIEHHPWLSDKISYYVGVDGLSLPFVILTTFLLPVSILASWTSIEDRVKEYMISFLLLETLMIGVFVSLDLVLFYLFFEGGLIPMFLIIGVWGGPRRVYASFKFFLYTLLGSLLMLLAILAMYGQAGTTEIPALLKFAVEHHFEFQTWLFFAFLASFAVKLPMWPVHTWLPDAHVEAPTAGSVILAAILLKMGGYGFLRFSLPMFPEASVSYAPLMFTLGVAAIIYTSLVAFAQKDMKKADRLFVGRAYGLRHARRLLRHRAGRARRGLPDDQPRRRLRRALPFGSASSTTGCTRARSRPMAGSPTACRCTPSCSWSSPWPMWGLPGTSGFIGEFLSLLGTFRVSNVAALFGDLRNYPVGALCADALPAHDLRQARKALARLR